MPLPSSLLSSTLADFLPPSPVYDPEPASVDYDPGSIVTHAPPSHHLVYFPSPAPLSSLLPDGTDPLQSPGPPYARRMWAGGKVSFPRPFELSGNPTLCYERICNVSAKGREGEEKIFVQIERQILVDSASPCWKRNDGEGLKKSRDIRNDLSLCAVIEHRNLVFMRQRSSKQAGDASKIPGKVLKPSYEPTFSHKLTPNAALLFRFSALTFNAHAIHLDKQYCQEVEGHRNLLVHGPLSLVLMVELLRRHLKEIAPKKGSVNRGSEKHITEIEYRNLAPLYAEEEMKVCGRRKGENQWEVWIEGRDGGYAVKGLASTK
ncbi:hypothetical protein MMC12_003699 [Toensbergia leucococca]|nr:hypothetical protein [Toensbergia leucococca]